MDCDAYKHLFLTSIKQKTIANYRWWLGLGLVGTVTHCTIKLSQLPWLQKAKLSPLTIGILLGIMIGNTIFSHIARHIDLGVDYDKSWLLKGGVILFGFKITFDQVASVGWQGILIDIIMLSTTFLLTMWLAQHIFKLDHQSAILIGAGSSICGAAAIIATEPMVKAQAHKVSIAVATVVVFGTLSLFIYPLAYPLLSLSYHNYGIFVGSTIHEVAQVVATGIAVSKQAANIAVIEKMLRVMLLAPFLFLLSFWYARKYDIKTERIHKEQKIFIPWFALFFIIAIGLNSLRIFSSQNTKNLIYLGDILLTMAMVALGLRTHIGAVRQAGIKPLLLGGCLFIFLTVGGFFLNSMISRL